jgi:hypothetical protein
MLHSRSLRGMIVALIALVIFATEARSLPADLTLPAAYSVRGEVTITLVAHFRGRSKTLVQRRPAGRDTFTINGDNTFSWADFADDGSPVTGTWTEDTPDVLTRTYDPDVAPRVAATVEASLRSQRGFRNASVEATMLPRPVRFRRSGDRVVGSDRVNLVITGAIVPIRGRMVIAWHGRKTN